MEFRGMDGPWTQTLRWFYNPPHRWKMSRVVSLISRISAKLTLRVPYKICYWKGSGDSETKKAIYNHISFHYFDGTGFYFCAFLRQGARSPCYWNLRPAE